MPNTAHKNENTKQKYKFRFSFVMPVYNVEKYLDETVQSVLDQNIGFEKNCEIIFIDDGSTDNSAKTCKRYVKEYPNNIRYEYQKNSGPGAARNKGIELATGEFINPIDSDDKISVDAASEAQKFFETYPDIDVVGLKWELFGAKTGPHPLNYRFQKQDRVIDLTQDYEDFQSSVAPAFFRARALKKQKFDTKIGLYAEDGRFMAEFLLRKPKYGALAKPTYYYRKRHNQTSSQDKNQTDKFWYLKTPKLVWLDLLEHTYKERMSIPKFLQFMVMYDLQWRIKQRELSALNSQEKKLYKKLLVRILQHIDEDIILSQKNIHSEHKLFALKLKYGKNFVHSVDFKNGITRLTRSKLIVINHGNNGFLAEIIEQDKNDNLIIEGRTKGLFAEGSKIGVKVSSESGKSRYIWAEKTERPHNKNYALDELVYDGGGFSLKVDVPKQGSIRIAPVVKSGATTTGLILKTGFLARVPEIEKFGLSFRLLKSFILTKQRNAFIVTAKTKKNILRKEVKNFLLLIPLVANKQLKQKVLVSENATKVKTKNLLIVVINALYSLVIRLAYYAALVFKKRQVWIVSDRILWADDNGEIFYDFLKAQPKNRFNAYFAIDKNTEDYQRIRNNGGKPIHYFGFKHQVLSLLADKFLSSEATEATLNTLGDRYGYLQGLLTYDFVFLEHGIIRDDLSAWLNKFNKNIKLFVASAQKERISILNSSYGYNKDEVVLTGLSRHDRLKDTSSKQDKKEIAIMPTWRTNIVGETSYKTNKRTYNPHFKNSDFFKFYSSLINDKEINKALERSNSYATLYLHHALQAQIKDFSPTSSVYIADFPHNYKEIKNKSSALVTDFSSVAFDFAYLNKPVVYAQFDEKTYYDNSPSSRGYLNYETSGFGEVCYDFKSTKKTILKLISKNFKQQDKFETRSKDFFYRIDNNNSHRVYQAILEMDDRDEHIERSVIHHSEQTNRQRLSTYWWRYGPPSELNFGDEITAYIVKSIFGINCEISRPAEARLVAAGSILHIVERNKTSSQPVAVWGSGLIDDAEKAPGHEKANYYAVRGKLTLNKIESVNSIPLGDPGILASLVFRSAKKKTHKIGVVFHYIDRDTATVKKLREREDVLLIDPLQTPDKVALDITSCEVVFSSSLHGMIFADSYNIPNYWMPLSGNVVGGDFKFRDHYSASDRKLIKVTPDVLYDAKKMEDLKKQYQPIPNLKKAQDDLIAAFPFAEGAKGDS